MRCDPGTSGSQPSTPSLSPPGWAYPPVCHREPDVPPYHLWGPVREICRERGQVGRLRESRGFLCDLLCQRPQAGWARKRAEGQRNTPKPASTKIGTGRARPGGVRGHPPLGRSSSACHCLASADPSETVSARSPATGGGRGGGQKAGSRGRGPRSGTLSWTHPQVTRVRGLDSGHFVLGGWKCSDPWQGA